MWSTLYDQAQKRLVSPIPYKGPCIRRPQKKLLVLNFFVDLEKEMNYYPVLVFDSPIVTSRVFVTRNIPQL
jgi:hypothetical protein